MAALRVERSWLQKAGNAPDEYEDASALRPASGRRPFRCAVADGATETSFSGFWAELLVEAYCAGELGSKRWLASLAPLQVRWWEDVRRRPLPWYAEEKSRAGAFAALVGLTLRPSGPEAVRWTALAVGDSCVIHLRAGENLGAFPIDSASDFGRSPALISSNSAANLNVRPRARSGVAQTGDLLVLATDALACTLLSDDRGPDGTRTLLAGLAPEQFAGTIERLRLCHELRNDDVTFVQVVVE